ncbi:putative calcium-binding protein CML19 [Platanthera guangdongensis]|uniref:Calcium-binding protein CML19 n=1 Tax=Platanthera guangdongensis TaxID=2320717 RepID=A0ABR2LW61_9ASPA
MNLNHKALEKVLCYFDQDNDGKITSSELRACMTVINDELSLEEAKALVELLDADGDGLLGLDDFIKFVETGEKTDQNEKEMREAFQIYEMNSQGYITVMSLKRMLSGLSFSRNIEICRGVISEFDMNSDGVLSFEEFKIMMMA